MSTPTAPPSINPTDSPCSGSLQAGCNACKLSKPNVHGSDHALKVFDGAVHRSTVIPRPRSTRRSAITLSMEELGLASVSFFACGLVRARAHT
jgi:hypothetical protein